MKKALTNDDMKDALELARPTQRRVLPAEGTACAKAQRKQGIADLKGDCCDRTKSTEELVVRFEAKETGWAHEKRSGHGAMGSH